MTFGFLPATYGEVVVLAGTSPAAGANYAVVVPATEVWLVRSVHFRLVTSAVAAQRIPQITYTIGGIQTLSTATSQGQLANNTRNWSFGVGQIRQSSTVTPTGGTAFTEQPLWNTYTLNGGTLGITVALIGVADQISQVIVTYQRWRV